MVPLAEPRSPADVPAARAAGWQFLAAPVAFAAGVAAVAATTDAGYVEAEQAAADRLGRSVAELPAAELARLNAEYSSAGVGDLAVVVLTSLGLILLTLAVGSAVRAVTGGGRYRALRAAANVLALAAPLGWIAYLALTGAVTSGAVPPTDMLELYDRFALPAMTVSTVGGSLALCCVAVLLRTRGMARRTGLAVLALSGLAVVGGVLAGLPPIVPCLLGAVLGVVLVRTRVDPAGSPADPSGVGAGAVR
jgi:hypothetical protein